MRKMLFGNKDVMIIFIIMLLIFSNVMFRVGVNSDLPLHVNIARDMMNSNHLFSNNFLMYFSINLLTCFSGNYQMMSWVLVVFLALSNTLKYYIVREDFLERYSRKISILASCSLLVVYIFPLMFFLKIFGIFCSANNMFAIITKSLFTNNILSVIIKLI